MSIELFLYIMTLIGRVSITVIILRKYGWKAMGWTLVYMLLTVLGEMQGVV